MSPSSNHVKNIAIVGGSGQVGLAILSALVEAGTFSITALTRADSTANFPSSVTVRKGDYSDHSFLVSTLKGQDTLIISLAVTASPDVQSQLIKAAAEAGVSWVLPNEYGQDGASDDLNALVKPLSSKIRYRKEIEELGKSSWIGVICNLWFDFSLKGGFYGIDIANRKAELYDDGNTIIEASTVSQTGKAVAKLLSLPVTSSSGKPSLSDYKNGFFYMHSFRVSQRQMLDAAQKATGTTDADWNIKYKPVDQFIQEGKDRFAKGDYVGLVGVLYGATFTKGLGDLYHGKELANVKIGLEDENVQEVVNRVVKEVEEGKAK